MSKRTQRPVVLSVADWRAQLKQGKVAGLAKHALIHVAKDGTVSFVASAFDPDRYGDTIDQTGWQLENYTKNPVLLWAHSHFTPPVGRVASMVNDGGSTGKLVASGIEFTPEEMNKFGADVGKMVKAGFLNAVSVGFLPIEWEERYDEGGRFKGYHFKKQELLELSVVPVPAHPQALALGAGAQFAKSLSEWMEAEVDENAAPITRGFKNELAGFFKAAQDLQTSAEDEADQGAFERMEQLLERIAKAAEAPRFTVKLGDMEVSGPSWEGVVKLCGELREKATALPAAPAPHSTVPASEPAPVVSEASVGEDASDPVLRLLAEG